MKIALYHNLPLGGALRVVESQVRSGPAVGLEFEVFGPQALPPGLKLGPFQPLMDLVWVAWQERRIGRQIESTDPDVVLVHSCRVTQAPLILRRLSAPSVYYAGEVRRRTYEPGYRPEVERRRGLPLRLAEIGRFAFQRLVTRRDRKAVAAAGRILCNSEQTAAELRRCYGAEAELCRPGIATTLFTPGNGARGNYVLSVGALDPTKGHHEVIEALGLIPAGVRPALAVVCQREARGWAAVLEAQCHAEGVELHLQRDLAEAELVGLYQSAIATVCAAINEPLGLVPIESSSCGTPVVAIRSGGYPETVIHQRNGVLVDPNPGAIAEGIQVVTRARRDGAFSAASVRAVVHPSWSRQSAAIRLGGALQRSLDRSRVAPAVIE